MIDLVLAILHHLGMFALLGVLAFTLASLGPGPGPHLERSRVLRLAQVDRLYGALSLAMIAIGFTRAILAAKGWDYYSHNGFFWAKMAAFAGVGLLSAPPSIRFVRWRRANDAPPAHEARRVRRYLVAQLALFALIPLFAAAMARGHGQFG